MSVCIDKVCEHWKSAGESCDIGRDGCWEAAAVADGDVDGYWIETDSINCENTLPSKAALSGRDTVDPENISEGGRSL